MSEIRFSAQPTPSFDPFETVTLAAMFRDGTGLGSAQVRQEVAPARARAFAEEIVRACEIVEREIEASA